MRLVETWTEIRQNLLRFDSYRTSLDPLEREFHSDRIRLGKCFVALDTDRGCIFGPSRFLGYADNDYQTHESNALKHGWDTNPAINLTLGRCEPNGEIEAVFLEFCGDHDIVPSNNKRKYWHVQRTRDFLADGE
jgi:hypothetical protein